LTDRPEDLWLIGLASDVCEGRPVDWRRAESQVASPEVDAILRGLKRLAGVVDAHRSIADPAAPGDVSVEDHPKVWRHLAVLEVAGVGAFGTVYRAWDARLEREVALKLLTVSGNRLPLTEAQHLARVRHPHIVTVYGAEQTEQQVGIWMEFIEGETLADSVGQRGSMSAREVAGIGIDLCRALSALHAAGLVHRDVKAQNVMREVGGRIVLMDFSGSGALDPGESGPELSGTPLYMAPELLEGFPASPVTDTYSVGVLLFYLLSGYLPVAGSSLADVRRAHIEGKRIHLRDLRPDLPDTVVEIVERAAHPDSGSRYSTAGDLEHALAGVLGAAPPIRLPAGPAVDDRRAVWSWREAGWAIGLLTLVVAALLGVLLFRPPVPATNPRMVRVTLGAPYNTASWPRLSPDGRLLVYGTVVDAGPVLWLRPLDTDAGRPLTGTVALESPFWSADSRQLGFFAEGKLKTIDVDSERIETLTDVGRPRGGAWNDSGVIVFSTDTGLDRIDPGGSRRQHLTLLDTKRGEYQHGWPQFLPDGRRFLYVVRSNVEANAAVYIGSLDSPIKQQLMPAYSRVVYSPTGHLLFVRRGTLMAQGFDPRSGQLSGEPQPIAGPVKFHGGNDAAFDVSNDILIYRLDEGLASSRLELLDRRGHEVQTIDGPASFRQPRFAPDMNRIAVEKSTPQSLDSNIWVYDIARRSDAQVTTSGTEVRPVWSPDGRRLIFSAKRGAFYNLYDKAADGSGDEHLIDDSPYDKLIEDCSADGRTLAVFVPRRGLWLYDVATRTHVMIRSTTTAGPMQAQFSPDSKFIAYAIESEGSGQVIVEPLPTTGVRWQVSRGAGAEPHWRADGRELVYVSGDGWLMSVAIPADRAFTPSAPQRLFQITIPELFGPADSTISRDGKHFVINQLVSYPNAPSIHVVANWLGLMKP